MKTYREWLLSQLNNDDIDLWWLDEFRKFKSKINNSDFNTANQLSGLLDKEEWDLEFEETEYAVIQSALSYIDYLYYIFLTPT